MPKESSVLYICSPGRYVAPLILQTHTLVEDDNCDVVASVDGGKVLVMSLIVVDPSEVDV